MRQTKVLKYFLMLSLLLPLASFSSSCTTKRDNAMGSDPLNGTEAQLYEQALIRCHKTGGSRIVKIQGRLRCF
ncbi:MAG: hypothetical protein KA436_04565 [Oligoflexales bacterium]|nr:hypothetical protein [Oligoflexales bacterium]